MSSVNHDRPGPGSAPVRGGIGAARFTPALVLLIAFVAACAEPEQLSPTLLTTSTATPSPSTPATSAVPSPSTDAFRVTGDEAAAVSTVERFVQFINVGNSDAAAALLSEDAVASDCDFANHTVIQSTGEASVSRWLKDRIADHDRFTIGEIFNENAVFGPVVGVQFSNRSSDTLARLGAPHGIVPKEVAKVVLTSDMAQIRAFALGPGGADPGVISDVCSP